MRPALRPSPLSSGVPHFGPQSAAHGAAQPTVPPAQPFAPGAGAAVVVPKWVGAGCAGAAGCVAAAFG